MVQNITGLNKKLALVKLTPTTNPRSQAEHSERSKHVTSEIEHQGHKARKGVSALSPKNERQALILLTLSKKFANQLQTASCRLRRTSIKNISNKNFSTKIQQVEKELSNLCYLVGSKEDSFEAKRYQLCSAVEDVARQIQQLKGVVENDETKDLRSLSSKHELLNVISDLCYAIDVISERVTFNGFGEAFQMLEYVAAWAGNVESSLHDLNVENPHHLRDYCHHLHASLAVLLKIAENLFYTASQLDNNDVQGSLLKTSFNMQESIVHLDRLVRRTRKLRVAKLCNTAYSLLIESDLFDLINFLNDELKNVDVEETVLQIICAAMALGHRYKRELHHAAKV